MRIFNCSNIYQFDTSTYILEYENYILVNKFTNPKSIEIDQQVNLFETTCNC